VLAIDQVLWLLALLVLSVLGRPWSRLLLGGLASQGALVSAPVGLFVFHFLYWLGLFPGWIPNGWGYAWAVLGVFAVLSFVLGGWRPKPASSAPTSPSGPPEIAGRLWRVGLLILVGAYALGVGLRALNPDVLGTEKPMDLALLNGVVRSAAYPPADPWFAGEPINYYYLGYSMAGALVHLSGTPPAVAYNLYLATLFALALLAAAAVGYDLAALLGGTARARRIGATVSAVVGIVGGNLFVLEAIFTDEYRGKPGFWEGLGWNASRVIQSSDANGLTDYTINEFPAFSFILGDLHPHVMALPFALVALNVAVRWIAVWWGRAAAWSSYPASALSGLLLGGLYGLNAWDLPTFAVLALGGAVCGHALGTAPRRWRALLAHAGLALLVGALAWLPFFLHFRPISTALSLVTVRSQANDFLLVFGLTGFLLLAGAWALCWDAGLGARWAAAALTVGAGALILVGRGEIVFGLMPVLALVGLVAIVRRDGPGITGFAWIGFVAVGLMVAVEVVAVRDFFGPPYARMNTVFKLHYQVWLLLAGLAGPAVVTVLARVRAPASVAASLARLGFLGVTVVLGMVALAYPFAAMRAKAEASTATGTLDGLAFVRQTLPDDWTAAEWLRDQAPQDAVVLEAPGKPYSDESRIGVWTGIPTVIGWDQHEELWRGNDAPRIRQRVADAERFYTAGDPAASLQVVRRYGVTYVFAGSVEARKYGPGVHAYLRSFLTPVFKRGGAEVYAVPPAP